RGGLDGPGAHAGPARTPPGGHRDAGRAGGPPHRPPRPPGRRGRGVPAAGRPAAVARRRHRAAAAPLGPPGPGCDQASGRAGGGRRERLARPEAAPAGHGTTATARSLALWRDNGRWQAGGRRRCLRRGQIRSCSVSLRGSVRGSPGRRTGFSRPRRPWWARLLRTTIGLIVVLLCLGLASFGLLLAITPSVGNARQIAREQDADHHVAYPGPSVPARFSAALKATEDHRFNSEPGIDFIAVARAGLGQVDGDGDQGGATLYQQLAKMLYTPNR